MNSCRHFIYNANNIFGSQNSKYGDFYFPFVGGSWALYKNIFLWNARLVRVYVLVELVLGTQAPVCNCNFKQLEDELRQRVEADAYCSISLFKAIPY